MKNDELKELIRAQVRSTIREQLADVTAQVLREELGLGAEPAPAPQPGAQPPTLPKRARQQRYGRQCFVRVNVNFRGSVGAAGSRTVEVWEAIRILLGAKDCNRTKLAKEVAQFLSLENKAPITAQLVTPQITKLLDGGALLLHTPRVGDAS